MCVLVEIFRGLNYTETGCSFTTELPYAMFFKVNFTIIPLLVNGMEGVNVTPCCRKVAPWRHPK